MFEDATRIPNDGEQRRARSVVRKRLFVSRGLFEKSDRSASRARPQLVPSERPRDDDQTIFEQDWWLLAATGGRLERAEVRWDGVVVGSLNYHPTVHRWMRKITLPPYTRVLAPRLTGPDAKAVTVIQNNTRIIRELFGKMKRFDSFATTIFPTSNLLLPFQFNGATSNFKASFVSPAADTVDDVLAAMHQKSRNTLRTISTQLTFSVHSDFSRFERIAVERNRGNDFNNYSVLEQLWAQVSVRDCGRVISAVDRSGRDIASCVVVWDARTMYYLLSTRSDSPEASKANIALIFESLCFAKTLGLDFDVDGYATLESGQFLAKLGLPMSIRATVEKQSAIYSVLKPIKAALSRSAPPL